jgi:transposase-like protein
MKRVYRKRYALRCSAHACRNEISLTKGTIFYKSTIRINYALYIVYLWSKKVEVMKIVELLGLNYRTVRRLLDRVHYIIGAMLEEQHTMIGGPGIIVEIDESKFGKRKYNRGHQVDGVWIVGGVERTAERRVFLVKVLRRSMEVLSDVITRNVLPGSIIYTDMWRGYNNLGLIGYTHMTVNHSENFVDPETGTCTNTIEGNWSTLKKRVPIRKRTYELITSSLNEFMFERMESVDIWTSIIRCMSEVEFEVEHT